MTGMINFIDTDFQTILDGFIAAFEAQAGTSVPATGLLRSLINVYGYREVMLRILANDAAAQSLVQYASGDNLDLVGDLWGVDRLATQAAVCNVRFTWASAIAVDYTIPAGTRVQTSDGAVIFATDEAVTAVAGVTYVDALATCTAGGTAGNDYPLGSVQTLLDTLAITPSTVGNTTVPEGGGDAETDERFRARIQESISTPSTAGTVEGYKAFTLAYNSEIVSVDVHSPAPGAVYVYPLLRGGTLPEEVFLAALQTYLRGDEVRPVCDTVSAIVPAAVSFTASVRLDFRLADAQLEGAALIEAERLITEWSDVIREQLRKDIIPEEIVALCQGLPGVYRVRVLSPAWTQIGVGQFPDCTSIDVQIGVEYDEA